MITIEEVVQLSLNLLKRAEIAEMKVGELQKELDELKKVEEYNVKAARRNPS